MLRHTIVWRCFVICNLYSSDERCSYTQTHIDDLKIQSFLCAALRVHLFVYYIPLYSSAHTCLPSHPYALTILRNSFNRSEMSNDAGVCSIFFNSFEFDPFIIVTLFRFISSPPYQSKSSSCYASLRLFGALKFKWRRPYCLDANDFFSSFFVFLSILRCCGCCCCRCRFICSVIRTNYMLLLWVAPNPVSCVCESVCECGLCYAVRAYQLVNGSLYPSNCLLRICCGSHHELNCNVANGGMVTMAPHSRCEMSVWLTKYDKN